jgi:hypothetical protein
MSTQSEPDSWQAMLTQVPQGWMEGCKAFSDASRAVVEGWAKGCTDQIQRNLAACTKLAVCKDPGEIAEIQQRWWRDTCDRLSAELQGYHEQLMALTRTNLSGSKGGPSSPARHSPAEKAA